MIDFVGANGRLRGLVRAARVMRGSDCGTDHNLSVLKINLDQGRRRKRARKKTLM